MKVRVEFIDDATGLPIARRQATPEDLAGILSPGARFKLSSREFALVSAAPPTREECEAAGSVKLRVKPAMLLMVPVDELLHALPTVSGAPPPVEEGEPKSGRWGFHMGEEDWRQVEVASKGAEGVVESCLGEIRRMFVHHREPNGYFRELYVRREMKAPLVGTNISLSDLQDAFEGTLNVLDGVSIRGTSAFIRDGYALEAYGGLRLYGTRIGERIACLGIWPWGAEKDAILNAAALRRLFLKFGLFLVDWIRPQRHGPADLERFLGGKPDSRPPQVKSENP